MVIMCRRSLFALAVGVEESEPNRGRQFPSTLMNVSDGMTVSDPIGYDTGICEVLTERAQRCARYAGRFSYAGDVDNRSEVLCD